MEGAPAVVCRSPRLSSSHAHLLSEQTQTRAQDSLELHLFSPHTPPPHRTHLTRTHTLMPIRRHHSIHSHARARTHTHHTSYTHILHTHLTHTPNTHTEHTPSTGDEKDEDKDDYRGRFDQAAVRAPPRATRHSYPPEARPECEQGGEEEVAASFEKDQCDPKPRMLIRNELEQMCGYIRIPP